MKSNYKKLGNYIQLVDNRNKELKDLPLVGVTVNKKFIPSVANTIGTNMSNYKLIKKDQFACSLMQVRRDGKIPVALMKDDEAIISQAYPVFEIQDTNELLPEYLMMWMSRSEFDREACFYAVGGVRGSLEWEDFCGMKLSVPSLDKQKEIVKEYHTITDRIKLNEELNQKLEDIAQTVYKEWFVNFEFPDENGKPYKSNGGKMEYCDELDMNIPKGWKESSWNNMATQFSGFSFKGEEYSFEKGVSVVRGENVTEQKLRWDTHKKWDKSLPKKAKNCFLKEYDIIIGMDGSKVGKNWTIIGKWELPLLLAQRVSCIRGKKDEWQSYLYYSMYINNFEYYVSQVYTGTSVPHISGEQIMDFQILEPNSQVLEEFNKNILPMIDLRLLRLQENYVFLELKEVLLSKMATIEG